MVRSIHGLQRHAGQFPPLAAAGAGLYRLVRPAQPQHLARPVRRPLGVEGAAARRIMGSQSRFRKDQFLGRKCTEEFADEMLGGRVPLDACGQQSGNRQQRHRLALRSVGPIQACRAASLSGATAFTASTAGNVK
jgi:hypothetical protein